MHRQLQIKSITLCYLAWCSLKNWYDFIFCKVTNPSFRHAATLYISAKTMSCVTFIAGFTSRRGWFRISREVSAHSTALKTVSPGILRLRVQWWNEWKHCVCKLFAYLNRWNSPNSVLHCSDSNANLTVCLVYTRIPLQFLWLFPFVSQTTSLVQMVLQCGHDTFVYSTSCWKEMAPCMLKVLGEFTYTKNCPACDQLTQDVCLLRV